MREGKGEEHKRKKHNYLVNIKNQQSKKTRQNKDTTRANQPKMINTTKTPNKKPTNLQQMRNMKKHKPECCTKNRKQEQTLKKSRSNYAGLKREYDKTKIGLIDI
jgi:hypothetical protein